MVKSKKTKYRVFLVDDHPLTRYGLSHLIDRETDLVVCGGSDCGLAALTAVGIAKPHAVVVGVASKKGRGVSLIKDLLALDPNLAILVLSDQEESSYAKQCLRAGAKGYLLMSEATTTVLHALRQVIAGEIMAAPSKVGKKGSD